MTALDHRPAVPTATAPPEPADAVGVLPPVVLGSLSPSRAADFMACPLRYRFRVVDRLPEPPSAAAARGTLVHAALERLYDLPSAERTPAAAADLLAPAWERLLTEEPELAAVLGEQDTDSWLADAGALLAGYFTLEDPRRLDPAARECYVETVLEGGLRLRGYIDRLDATPAGDLRVVDYKTGRAPREAFEARALFQMKFYALVLWRTRGVIARELKLVYLGDRATLTYCPDEADLVATERKLRALWSAIDRAHTSGDWRPARGPLCSWCDHQSLCPEFGGTPPPLPPGSRDSHRGDAPPGRDATVPAAVDA